MRRTLAVLVMCGLALALVGCGGGAKTATTAAPAADPAAAPAAVAPPAAALVGDRSENETAAFEPFPQGSFVPAELKANIDAKRPTLIFFYDSSYMSKADRTIIDTVRDANRGLIDLVAYDIGRYVSTTPDGQTSVDPLLTSDPTGTQAVQLAKELGVSSVPFVVITDGQGYITWKYRGLLDKAFLEREVLRTSR